jgi:hypothetical protein
MIKENWDQFKNILLFVIVAHLSWNSGVLHGKGIFLETLKESLFFFVIYLAVAFVCFLIFKGLRKFFSKKKILE